MLEIQLGIPVVMNGLLIYIGIEKEIVVDLK